MATRGRVDTDRPDRAMQTFAPTQNPEGGFGGAHGQLSHLAASYTTVLCLVMVGGRESIDMINRRSLSACCYAMSYGEANRTQDGNGSVN